ncbi:MAG TPA: hypothetical protein VFA12_20445 [Stellaceae bacterium]|nr:hypothetical protein [Stellaceae bacterium]
MTPAPILDLPVERFPTACREREYGDGKRCWRGLWRRWQHLPAEPLHIVGTLASGYIAPLDGALHLDGLLSAACLSLWASVVDDGIERYVIPLPLALAWASPAGDPLWLASDLRPIGAASRGSAYLHSRYPSERADLAVRQTAPTKAGRYKDVRMPLAVTVTAAVEGWCIGDRNAVTMLLDRVWHVGRKGAHGRGRVLSWQIEPAPEIDADYILDHRNVPVAYLAAKGLAVAPERLSPRLGWTPPYWHPASMAAVRTALRQG